MNKTLSLLVVLSSVLLLAVPEADAAGRVKARGARPNAEGGVTGGQAAAVRGPNGGGLARGRAYTTDGQGNGQAASGGVVRTPGGGTGVRAGATQWSQDGSVQHESGAQFSGPQGTAATHGQFTRDASGAVSGGRATTAEGAQGGRYDATTSYGNGTAQRSVDATGTSGYRYESDVTATRGEGVERTATCYDPQGNVVPCPR